MRIATMMSLGVLALSGAAVAQVATDQAAPQAVEDNAAATEDAAAPDSTATAPDAAAPDATATDDAAAAPAETEDGAPAADDATAEQ